MANGLWPESCGLRLSVVLGQSLFVADVLHRGEDLQDVSQQSSVDWLREPLGPFADVAGIGAASNCCRDIGVFARELHRQLGDVDSVLLAQGCGGAGGGFDVLGLFEPGGQRGVRQQPGAEGASVHDADAFLLQIGHSLVGKASVLQRVLVVREHAVDIDLVADEPEDLHRVTAEADEPHLAGLLNFPQGGNRLVDDLLHRHELDVVAQHDVEVIRPQPVQRDVDTFRDALGRELEVPQVIPPQFRAKQVAVARDATQGNPQQDLAHPAPVERRGVDEVQPAFEGHSHAGQGLVQLHAAKLLTEGGGSEAEDRKLQAGAAQRTSLHEEG